MGLFDYGYDTSDYGDPYAWMYGGQNSGQIGFSGGTSGNWWEGQTDSGGWAYDPSTDEYYRPDGDYSGGDTYPGSAPNFSVTGTGYQDDPDYYGLNNSPGGSPDPGGPIFRGGVTELNPMDPIPSDSPDKLDDPNYPDLNPPIGREYDGGYKRRPINGVNTAIGTPKPSQPAQAPQPAQKSAAPAPSTTNISAPTIHNTTTPGITSDVPDTRATPYSPQYLPQSERSKPLDMEPVGADRNNYTEESEFDPYGTDGSSADYAGFSNEAVKKPKTPYQASADAAMSVFGLNKYKKLADDVKNKRGLGILTDVLNLNRR